MWKRGNVVLVTLPGSQIIGRVCKAETVFSDKIARLENPFFLTLEKTEKGSIPSLTPCSALLAAPLRYLDIGPNQYIFAGVVRNELNVLYSNAEEEFKKSLPVEAPKIEVEQVSSKKEALKKAVKTKNGCRVLQFKP